MSSVDLSDPHISEAYDALASGGPLRWFLLTYGNGPNELCLCASGRGDIADFRSHITLGNVCYYGIFREQTQNKTLYVSLNYIPDSVKGVWRARALVHGKAVSSKFKAHQTLNASNPDQINLQALRSILRLPPREPQGETQTTLGLGIPSRGFSIPRKPTPDTRSTSLSLPPSRTRSPSPTPTDAHPRSTSSPQPWSSPLESQLHTVSPSNISPPGTGYHASSSFPTSSASTTTSPPSLVNIATGTPLESAVKSSPHSSPVVHSPSPLTVGFTSGAQGPQTLHSPQHASWFAKQGSPLPPPPSSESQRGSQDAEQKSDTSDDQSPASPHVGSIPDTESVASRRSSDRPVSPTAFPQPPINVSSTRSAGSISASIVEGLPAPSLIPPPVIQEQGNTSHLGRTAEDTAQVQASKNVRTKFHERAATLADAEEERKLMVLDEERRRRAAERAKREKEEREEEEAREREFEERQERERKRRVESAKRAEERRAEQKRQQQEEEIRRKTEQQQKEEETRQRRNHIQQRFEKQSEMDLLSGFITLESSSSWKRRYYRLSTEGWVFFKSDEDVTTPLHALELSRVRALREWHEGYEELEAIPNSFAVELNDDSPWLFFADSAEDKEILLGLLTQAAGL